MLSNCGVFGRERTIIMRVTMLGSHLCPDCVEACKLFTKYGIGVDYFDITENLSYLRDFLKLREHCGIFNAVAEQNKIGIPCMILPGGAVLLSPEDVLAAAGRL